MAAPVFAQLLWGTYSGLETELSMGQVQRAGCQESITAFYSVIAELFNFFAKKGARLAPEVIHNPTALIDNYFFVLSHKNLLSK